MKTLKIALKCVLFIIGVWLVVVGQPRAKVMLFSIEFNGLLLIAIGIMILLFLLWDYNRKFQ